jgi:hypothetical protein
VDWPYPDKPDLVLKAGTEVWLSDSKPQHFTLAGDWHPDQGRTDWVLKAGTEVWQYPDGKIQRFTLAGDWHPDPNKSDWMLRAGTEVWLSPDGNLQRFTLAKDWRPDPISPDWVLKAGTEVWQYFNGGFQRFTLSGYWRPNLGRTDWVLKAGTEVWQYPGGNLQQFTVLNDVRPDPPDGSRQAAELKKGGLLFHGSVVELYDNGFFKQATLTEDLMFEGGICAKAGMPLYWHENGHIAEFTLKTPWRSPAGDYFSAGESIVCLKKGNNWVYERKN